MSALNLSRLTQLAEQIFAIKAQQWTLQGILIAKKLCVLLLCMRTVSLCLAASIVILVISTPLIWAASAYSDIFICITLSSGVLCLTLLVLLRFIFSDRTLLRHIQLVDTRVPLAPPNEAELQQQREALLKQLETLITDLKSPSV